MNKKIDIILDLEFNGLPRYNFTPEISQVKLYNTETKVTYCYNYKTKNKATIGSLLKTGKITGEKLFSCEEFYKIIKEVTDRPLEEIRFVGFSNKTDKEILKGYGIEISFYDLQEELMLSRSYEKALAENGRSMETCYYILFNKEITPSHNGIEELFPLIKIYKVVKQLYKNKYLTVYPWGEEAGMPLKEYIENNRRRADGYRFNNNDILAMSLNNLIDGDDDYDW